MSAVARFLRPSQKAGYEAVIAKARSIASGLDELWAGIDPRAIKPSGNLRRAMAGADEVETLRRVSTWLEREMAIDRPLGELGDEMLELKGECLGLALWIEGRL